eukprot:TRINITY_DN28720_c1_g1_i6.p2 TRINITY_DN28720_c1_g1~~TRINITY_DN28720_c1_g1_i6.p2  ORF type:complete len:279 (-),score=32.39 TRINITY_DN28720_c1_g1_i6:10-846(-)
MQNLKGISMSRLAMFIGGVVLTLGVAWPMLGTAQVQSDKVKALDPHAQHRDHAPQKDKQAAADQDLASQIAELKAKVARLEAALEKSQASRMNGMVVKKKPPANMDTMGGKKPAMGMMEDDMDEMGSMQPGQGAPAAGGMGRGEMRMKMDKMMGMMEKMMAGTAMKPAPGMAAMSGKQPAVAMMGDDMDEMASIQPTPGVPDSGGMGGGEMSMKMDRMMTMMEKMMARGAMRPAGGAAGTGDDELERKMDRMLRMMEKMMNGAMQPGQAAPAQEMEKK